MAIWQVSFFVIRETKLKTIDVMNVEANQDALLVWDETQISIDSLEKISKVLPPTISWSENIKQFGEIESTCVNLFYSNNGTGNVEISCRLDIRSLSESEFLTIIDFINQNNGVILYEYEIYEATVNSLKNIITNSRSFKFCKDPKAFLDSLSPKKKIPELKTNEVNMRMCKGARYMLLEKDQRFFLIDEDENWPLFIALTLRFLCTFQAFEISASEANRLELLEENVINNLLVVIISSIGASSLRFFSHYRVEGVDVFSFSVFSIAILLICICTRCIWRRNTDASIQYLLETGRKFKLKFRPKNFKGYLSFLFSFGVTAMFIGIVVVSFYNVSKGETTVTDFLVVAGLCIYSFGIHFVYPAPAKLFSPHIKESE